MPRLRCKCLERLLCKPLKIKTKDATYMHICTRGDVETEGIREWTQQQVEF